MFSLGGFKGNMPALLAGGNFFPYIASLALAIYLADRVGRRKMMLFGCGMMCTILIVGGILAKEIDRYKSSDPAKAKQFGAGVAAVLYMYTATYGGTWLTTCWVYPTGKLSSPFPYLCKLFVSCEMARLIHFPVVEIFPLASRARGAALSTVAFSLAGGVINEIVPYLISAVGFWVFIIFALINFVIMIPIWLFYPETANRHLEDLDLLFATRSPFARQMEKEFVKHQEQNGSLGGDVFKQEERYLEDV